MAHHNAKKHLKWMSPTCCANRSFITFFYVDPIHYFKSNSNREYVLFNDLYASHTLKKKTPHCRFVKTELMMINLLQMKLKSVYKCFRQILFNLSRVSAKLSYISFWFILIQGTPSNCALKFKTMRLLIPRLDPFTRKFT